EVGYSNSIALDNEGGVHVSYLYSMDHFVRNLKYAYKPKDGSWSNYTIDSTAHVGSFSSLAIDKKDGIHISYYDITNGDLKYAYKPKDRSWSNYTIDFADNVGLYTSIAVDNSNHVHISYYDDTNHELKYATDITIPSAPQNVNATPGDSKVMLTWDAPTSDGGSPVTNYNVYRGITPGGETLVKMVGNILNYTDTGLDNGETYYYKISALNSMGEGPQSNEVNATPFALPKEKSIFEEIWLWIFIGIIVIAFIVIAFLLRMKEV
ncbi:MAG: fibronectin type III domain-containing protein, partial [Thermoplasmata archaeon]